MIVKNKIYVKVRTQGLCIWIPVFSYVGAKIKQLRYFGKIVAAQPIYDAIAHLQAGGDKPGEFLYNTLKEDLIFENEKPIYLNRTATVRKSA